MSATAEPAAAFLAAGGDTAVFCGFLPEPPVAAELSGRALLLFGLSGLALEPALLVEPEAAAAIAAAGSMMVVELGAWRAAEPLHRASWVELLPSPGRE